MKSISKVINSMINYYGTDIKRINHFLKVYAFAKTIGESENLNNDDLELLEVSAVVHDIGIKISEQKYNSSAGKYQELEGAAEAKKLLKNLNYDDKFINEVCYLVGHHHTYNNINSVPYQILVESDFIVNLYEDNASTQAVKNSYCKIFKTNSSKNILKKMFFEL